ncbi:YndM family protein [Aquibacillus salsiterrae]|uniref:YndM family protein n=1 Tax=Aquibacillus salsiterrae TaxID=2950439 RepID=A0A9X3WIX8_9BACI|nr:YndM family protein [Aquibacillus salsiterrae]MDC3417901.1 YndM family protein [Aquibacillus salsiterrae]
MNHLKAISIKFIVVTIVLYSVLSGFYSASIGNIFVMSLLVTGIAYVIGDLFILPKFGNLIATLADFGLAFFSLWVLTDVMFASDYGIITASIFSAILISSTEAIFHLYMQSKILDSDDSMYIKDVRKYQTEAGEENPDWDIIEIKKRKEK